MGDKNLYLVCILIAVVPIGYDCPCTVAGSVLVLHPKFSAHLLHLQFTANRGITMV